MPPRMIEVDDGYAVMPKAPRPTAPRPATPRLTPPAQPVPTQPATPPSMPIDDTPPIPTSQPKPKQPDSRSPTAVSVSKPTPVRRPEYLDDTLDIPQAGRAKTTSPAQYSRFVQPRNVPAEVIVAASGSRLAQAVLTALSHESMPTLESAEKYLARFARYGWDEEETEQARNVLSAWQEQQTIRDNLRRQFNEIFTREGRLEILQSLLERAAYVTGTQLFNANNQWSLASRQQLTKVDIIVATMTTFHETSEGRLGATSLYPWPAFNYSGILGRSPIGVIGVPAQPPLPNDPESGIGAHWNYYGVAQFIQDNDPLALFVVPPILDSVSPERDRRDIIAEYDRNFTEAMVRVNDYFETHPDDPLAQRYLEVSQTVHEQADLFNTGASDPTNLSTQAVTITQGNDNANISVLPTGSLIDIIGAYVQHKLLVSQLNKPNVEGTNSLMDPDNTDTGTILQYSPSFIRIDDSGEVTFTGIRFQTTTYTYVGLNPDH